eukprot:11775364-Alexandrium_andersonii.AAC.1
MLLFLETFKKGGASERNAGTPGSGKRRRLANSTAFSSPAFSPAEPSRSGQLRAGEKAGEENA